MFKEKDRPIGIFDSGIGGLTVVRSLAKRMPREDIIYFGDTARVPYGNKSKSTIIRFSEQIMEFLVKKKVKYVIIACNTASGFALEHIENKYSLPVEGVIKSGVEEAVKLSGGPKIGVIGTRSTIESGSYLKELKSKDPSFTLYSQACPLLVPLVENGFIDDEITLSVCERYFIDLKKEDLDALILGCTHYPVIKRTIKKVMGSVPLVDSSEAISKLVEKRLEEMGLITKKREKGVIKCFVSDDAEGFKRSCGLFLHEDISISEVVL